jgi:hypothetical protein
LEETSSPVYPDSHLQHLSCKALLDPSLELVLADLRVTQASGWWLLTEILLFHIF